jgi:cytidylate kinase
MSDYLVITIDGPSGVGKSTVSKKVAAALDCTYLDTGAMYRAVAFYMQLNRIDISDSEAVAGELDNLFIELLPVGREDEGVAVRLNGEVLGDIIRTQEISMLASQVSAIPAVRKKLTEMQQQMGGNGNIVAEGRDMGTVVFPGALYKFYLDAAPAERVARRAQQLRAQGKEVDEDDLLKMTIERDRNDSERAVAPLKKADDALYIDTGTMTAQEVVDKIIRTISIT